ncbi:hypothetical protein MMC07_007557 [Pseudocyphellaria aurata]|nr:hypothetical protein [Pseudocyphellaria aurata]
MRISYTILEFLALTLASVISTQSRPTPVNLLDRPSTTKTAHGLGFGRDLITEKPPAASISTSSTNTTTHSPASSTFPPQQTSSSLPQQSQWGPDAISDILFGCVASILGAITVGLTYYLHRRQSRGQQSDDSMEQDNMRSFEPSEGNGCGGLPLEDLSPAYTSVGASAGGPSQQSQQNMGFPSALLQED